MLWPSLLCYLLIYLHDYYGYILYQPIVHIPIVCDPDDRTLMYLFYSEYTILLSSIPMVSYHHATDTGDDKIGELACKWDFEPTLYHSTAVGNGHPHSTQKMWDISAYALNICDK